MGVGPACFGYRFWEKDLRGLIVHRLHRTWQDDVGCSPQLLTRHWENCRLQIGSSLVIVLVSGQGFWRDPDQLKCVQWKTSSIRSDWGTQLLKVWWKQRACSEREKTLGVMVTDCRSSRTACRREHSSSAWANQETPEWKIQEAGFLGRSICPSRWAPVKQSCCLRCCGGPPAWRQVINSTARLYLCGFFLFLTSISPSLTFLIVCGHRSLNILPLVLNWGH